MQRWKKRLKKPQFWLGLFLFIVLLFLADSFRKPSNQLGAKLYVGAVGGYQKISRPAFKGRVNCRFEPSCSEYSIEAVQKHGIRRGLALTASRLWRCRKSVPDGTRDPVPD